MAKYTGPKAPGVSRDKMRRAREREQDARSEEAKKSTRASTERRRGPVARLLNGPRDGQVDTIDRLHAHKRSEEYFGHQYGYKPTRRTTRLPEKLAAREGETAQVWEWVGEKRRTWPSTPGLTRMDCSREGCGRQLLHPETRRRGVCTTCEPLAAGLPAGWGG